MVREIRKTGIPTVQVTAEILTAIQIVAILIAVDPTDWRNSRWVTVAIVAADFGRSRSLSAPRGPRATP
jgi:hypothetical protein